MTESTGDYFSMTGVHYEHGVHVLTSTRTLPGRFGGALDVGLPATVYQDREDARTALGALVAALPRPLAFRVEETANTLAMCEWHLALANALHGFTADIGEPSVIYLERSAAAPGGEGQPGNIPAGRYPLSARQSWRGRRVLALMGGGLMAGATIGAAVVAGTLARGRSR